MDAYDSFPYESIAFPETHPNNLAVLAGLLGLAAAPPSSARVLELGCAGAGNLIPMAYRLPDARFIGIDLSAPQVEAGQRLVRRLRLDNISLRQGDILDLGTELGEFDYVIAHGIYSWVPSQVREHLLGLVPRLLAPAGLFYVSYNTLPGWRMRGMLRDILLYACRGASTPPERIASARAALERLRTSLEDLDALSAAYLREEIAQLDRVHPSYLLFEYLAEHNQPFLFSDFARDADAAGLRYLCDTDLRTLFPSSYGSQVEQSLEPIEDGLELEQWLDFVTNRNFRQSVLCRSDADLPEDIAFDLDRFSLLAFRSELRPRERPDLRNMKAASFTSPSGAELRISHPLTKALVLRLTALYPDCLTLPELMPAAIKQVEKAGGGELAAGLDACLEELFSLFAHAGVAAQPAPLRLEPQTSDKPRISPLARAQLDEGADQITTMHHGNLDLDAFATRLLDCLDGSHSLEQAAGILTDDLETGRLQPPKDIRPSQWSREKLQARVRSAVTELVELFARQGILCGPSRDR